MPTDRRIHLSGPAGTCRGFISQLGLDSADDLVALVSRFSGDRWRVTCDRESLEVQEDEQNGGRSDDLQRAEEIQSALADDDTAAIITIRGGAWFARILPLIDFSVLDHRTGPVAVFGFSELTGLINIVASYDNGIGIYDMGPAFLSYGLKQHAFKHGTDVTDGQSPGSWTRSKLHHYLELYVRDVITIIEGRGSGRQIKARLVSGELRAPLNAQFVGGNLTVLSTLVGSLFRERTAPKGKWLVIEDFNDKLERIDRFLAHLTLADWWSICEGVLVGDFHLDTHDQKPDVLTLLKYHLRGKDVPLLSTEQIGHVWPMAPLPMHHDITIERSGRYDFLLTWALAGLKCI